MSRYPIDADSLLELPEDLGKLAPMDERLANLPMVGDVNIFLYGVPPHLRSISPNTTALEDDEDDFYAEVEIMIAGSCVQCMLEMLLTNKKKPEPSFRRKGLALEALQLMLGYATGQPQAFRVGDVPLPHPHSFADSPLQIPPTSLVTKISDTNTPSIRLFEKLGFEVAKRVEVFQEVEMRYRRSIS